MVFSGQIRGDDPGEPTTGRPRVSVAPDEEMVLSGLAAGKDVLEIGTGLCVSAIALSLLAKSVVTIDVDPWVAANISPLLMERGALCSSVIPDGREYDLVFIDGDHSASSVANDISRCLPLLRPGGVLVLHDALCDNVRRGCKASGVEMFVLPTTYGIGLWVK